MGIFNLILFILGGFLVTVSPPAESRSSAVAKKCGTLVCGANQDLFCGLNSEPMDPVVFSKTKARYFLGSHNTWNTRHSLSYIINNQYSQSLVYAHYRLYLRYERLII